MNFEIQKRIVEIRISKLTRLGAFGSAMVFGTYTPCGLRFGMSLGALAPHGRQACQKAHAAGQKLSTARSRAPLIAFPAGLCDHVATIAAGSPGGTIRNDALD